MTITPYGLCPACHAPGINRERRPNGYDCCSQGHRYLSKEAIGTPPPPIITTFTPEYAIPPATADMIKVMQAYLNDPSTPIEKQRWGESEWVRLTAIPAWDWYHNTYRVAKSS